MPSATINGAFKMKRALPRHRHPLRASRLCLMGCLQDGRRLGACMETAE